MENSSSLRSSGVIPFCLEQTTQTIYILLAKVNAESLMKGRFSVWGDLGGTPEDRETSEQTAAREFLEESLGILGGARSLLGHLQEGKYFVRIRIKSTQDSVLFHQDFFLKEFNFDPAVHTAFRDARETLLGPPERIQRSLLPPFVACHEDLIIDSQVNPIFMEKQELKWFSIDHIIDIIEGGGRHNGVKLKKSYLEPLRRAVGELLRFTPTP
jgi:8-oxo-dGTP pyrophosphatase MutT (NUDIX family)